MHFSYTFSFPITRRFALACAMVAMFFSAPVVAAEVADVKIEETVQIGNQLLTLNGAGIRYKVIFKVYTTALYLAEKKTTTAEVLALPGAKRVAMVMLRDLSSDDLGIRFMEGIRKNAEVAERAKLVNAMLTFGQMFALIPEIKKGDVLTVDWVPGSGVECQYNGRKLGETIQDANFYAALLKIWIGESPADNKLKSLLLRS
jgi:hypothetical protein